MPTVAQMEYCSPWGANGLKSRQLKVDDAVSTEIYANKREQCRVPCDRESAPIGSSAP